MAITLPTRQEVRGQGTVPAARAARLPTAADVPTVNPAVSADPGVQAPQGAFGGGQGLVAAGEMLGQAAERLSAAQARIQSRQDAVEVSRLTSTMQERSAAELRRLQTEGDLSDQATVDGYAKFLDDTKNELFGSFKGAPAGQAQLRIQFNNLQATFADHASVANIQAGRALVGKAFGEKLSGLTAAATRDPSRLPQLFDSVDAELDLLAPALSPDDEETFRATARQEITLSAVNSLLARGDAEDAESLLQDVPGVLEIMTPAQQRELLGRFDAIRTQKNEALFAAQRKVQAAEMIAGRRLTVAERTRLAGLEAPAGRQTAADKIRETEAALERPLTPAERAKVAGLDVERPTAATDAGKAIQDREMFVRQYGSESPQVAAFDEAMQSSGDAPTLSDVGGIRREFTNLSQDFVDVRDAFLRLAAVAADPNAMTAAGDVSLIFQFMKMLDPGGRVTEGEIAITGDTTGVPGQVINAYNAAVSGTTLNPQQRQNFKDQAELLMRAQMRSHTNTEREYRRIAESSGMNPDDVIVDFVGDDFRGRFTVEADAGAGGPKLKPRYDITGRLIGGGNGAPAEGAQAPAGATGTAVPASAPIDGPAPGVVADGAPSDLQALSDAELMDRLRAALGGRSPSAGVVDFNDLPE